MFPFNTFANAGLPQSYEETPILFVEGLPLSVIRRQISGELLVNSAQLVQKLPQELMIELSPDRN